jgi:hypothetical protein
MPIETLAAQEKTNVMEYSKLTKTKHNSAQLNWNRELLEQNLLSAPIGVLEQMSASLLAVVLKGIHRLSRWFYVQAKIAPLMANCCADECPSLFVVEAKARINSRGLEIIKQFEGFPPDVDPDVREAEQVVKRLVNVPLTFNQFSALVSFTYNLGETTFKQSDLLKQLNAGRYRAAAKEFDRWVYIGSSRFPKLVARRRAERKLFLQNDSLRTNH